MNTKNLPVVSLVSAVVLIGLGILALAVVPQQLTTTPVFVALLGLVVTTVPSLLASVFAEQASKDIRNGVITEKVKEALAVLEQNTQATQTNTNVTQAARHDEQQRGK